MFTGSSPTPFAFMVAAAHAFVKFDLTFKHDLSELYHAVVVDRLTKQSIELLSSL